MELIIVDSKEYKNYFNSTYHIFNSVEFSELNKDKVEELYYFVFKDSKVRLGIIFGKRGNTLYSPFSAPFGGFSYIKDDISIDFIDNAILLLQDYAENLNLSIKISIPPSIYSNDFISKTINSLLRSKFTITYCDINYSIDVNRIEDYKSYIWRNARKNLNNSEKHNLEFKIALNIEDTKLAYSVIKENRENKGYPLRMQLGSVLETIKIVQSDFFNLFFEGVSIASAQIFYVSKDIVQIIYWGDKPGYEHIRPMNFLAYKVFEYYKNIGIKHIDIGPSSENGIPNYGLCEFKESIGCSITNKFTFVYDGK